ncbi:MORC family CW-type zinc finger protein 3 [Helianthus annuus]|uniref:MORC family CW-type zinc finger protein 3 n=1 Tax=Helianthus annuus TaxID=4232 RepID=UPI000B8F0AD9|nr:MORC family CW-type zinc finger protein 3 [Helianthus annuus]KAJ0542639.1 putative transcription factor & chromatin remodeling CW-Zn family [Helianthus annuus]
MAELCHKSQEVHKEDEDGFQCYVLLVQDRKSICRVRCSEPAIAVYRSWEVITYIKEEHVPSGLHCTNIYPAWEDARQTNEWPKFLGYLKTSRKAAFVSTESGQLYILPSRLNEEYSHAVVRYLTHGHGVTRSQIHVKSEDHKSKEMPESRTDDRSRSENSATSLTGPRKNYACAHPSYLKTLAQSHSDWIFGAIAEFVDNSRDAKATMFDISIDMIYSRVVGKDIPMLAILDDGHGMSHEEIMKMMSFGRKEPNANDPNCIGRYGVGFKTGAMRLGRDALVLTQTTNSRSIAFLSQSLNEDKDNIEIPIVTYSRKGQYMEVDTNIQTETSSNNNLKAIMEFSPFNEYFIGEKAGLFDRQGTGTQIYIWNLDEWGSEYSLEWVNTNGSSSFYQGDIYIRSRRPRSRLGQMTKEVPLDYSLRSYLEVIFLDPRMKIKVQGSLVKSRPLAKFLHKTSIENGFVSEKPVQLILGHSQLDLEQGNCGIFLYWHGRLIEAYKRVGSMIHNGEKSHGLVGVIDVTDVMDDDSGRVWVHNNKQGFVDCEPYALLEDWLSEKADDYLDNTVDKVNVKKGGVRYKPDREWVQCNKCRKWRTLPTDFDSRTLPLEWFCYMKPVNGKCEMPEQKLDSGVITISSQRTGYNCKENSAESEHEDDRQPLKRLRRGSKI